MHTFPLPLPTVSRHVGVHKREVINLLNFQVTRKKKKEFLAKNQEVSLHLYVREV